MNDSTVMSPLEQFTSEVSNILQSGKEEAAFLPEIGESMKKLVAQDNWLNEDYAKPHPEYYQQYLLYAAPDDSFSVVSFVWGPGQQTPIHNHTVWGVIGMLRGEENEQSYELGENNTPQAIQLATQLLPGDIGFVSPDIGDIHRVSNGLKDQVSISIHAYGGNIGKISRHVYPPEGGEPKTFISGYSNS